MKCLAAAGQCRYSGDFAASDADASLQRFSLTDKLLFSLVSQRHQLLRPAPQQHSLACQDDLPCAALHEPDAQFFLQHGELPGERRLGDMQHLCGVGNVFLPRDSQKITQYPQFHSLFLLVICHDHSRNSLSRQDLQKAAEVFFAVQMPFSSLRGNTQGKARWK